MSPTVRQDKQTKKVVRRRHHAANWTFLTNHAHVLLAIALDCGLRMRDIAQRVGITERAVQRIIADLVQAGYVSRVRSGRRNHYRVHAEQPLKHPLESHQPLSALMALVADPQHCDPEPAEATGAAGSRRKRSAEPSRKG